MQVCKIARHLSSSKREEHLIFCPIQLYYHSQDAKFPPVLPIPLGRTQLPWQMESGKAWREMDKFAGKVAINIRDPSGQMNTLQNVWLGFGDFFVLVSHNSRICQEVKTQCGRKNYPSPSGENLLSVIPR